MTMSNKTAPKDTPNLAKEGKAKARPTNYTEKVVFDQLDRIERILKDHGSKINELLDRTEDRITGSPAPIRIHITKPGDTVVLPSSAPQPEGLQPGDYTDASKEVADALTAMGFKPMTGTTYLHNFIGWAHGGVIEARGGLIAKGYITPSTFLSRAAVTAKEIGLVPVVEKWVPKVGDYFVVVKNSDPGGWPQWNHMGRMDALIGTVRRVEGFQPESRLGTKTVGCGEWDWKVSDLRPATEAEIAAHLAEQEARANAEKLAKLKFGVHVVHLGRECVALQPAIMNRVDIAKLNAAGKHYFENVHIDDITVIDPQP